jgi:glycosyltransferase involved in cell wall biosynthesis
VTSEYPAVSETFVVREIRQLRAMNFDIKVASINRPAHSLARMTEAEREEVRGTFYVKVAGLGAILRAHLSTLARTPVAYLRGLVFAIRLGGLDLRRILFGIFYFGEAVVIGQWMQSLKARQLHVHFANAASTVVLIASRTFPIDFSFTMHGPDELYDVPGFFLKEKIAAASMVCCIGYFARSQLMRLAAPADWGKLKVVPLGIDPSIFVARKSRPRPATLEVVCVGRLVPAKGQHILLDAVATLVRSGHKLRLRFVGDGPDRPSLERAAAQLDDVVIFEGAVNQDRVVGIYRDADIFVLASFAEGIPVVLMEAMAMEVPCISTYVAGIPELIRNEIDGILVMPSDDRALAAAIERLILDPDLRTRLGAAGRKRVMQKYDLNCNVAHLAQLFSNRTPEFLRK